MMRDFFNFLRIHPANFLDGVASERQEIIMNEQRDEEHDLDKSVDVFATT